MKIVVRCVNCERVIRKHGSFTAKLEHKTSNKDTGDEQISKTVIKLCRPCAKEAGYKVKERK